MALCALVLLDIINQDFETTIHASMVKIETEAPNLQRFSSAFMLAGVDAGGERIENLIVTGEQRTLVDIFVALINRRIQRRCRNHEAFVHGCDPVVDVDLQIAGWFTVRDQALGLRDERSVYCKP